jgi:hypothetical protein
MKYEFFIKRNRLIVIGISLIVFLIIGGWYGQRTKKMASLPADLPKESAIKTPAVPKNVYSRISFFLRSPINGSLAIPESWEGKYRTKEEGNQINLDFVNDPKLETNIFYVKFYTLKEWNDIAKNGHTKERELQRKDEMVYVYHITETNPYQGDNQTYFKNMTTEASNIILSLRLFKNN